MPVSAAQFDDEASQRWARLGAGGLYLFIALAGVIAYDAPLTTLSPRLIGLILDVAVGTALLVWRVPAVVLLSAFLASWTSDAGSFARDLQFDQMYRFEIALLVRFARLVGFFYALHVVIAPPGQNRRRARAAGVVAVLLAAAAIVLQALNLHPALEGSFVPLRAGLLRGPDYALTLPADFEQRDGNFLRFDTWAVDRQRQTHVRTWCDSVEGDDVHVRQLIRELEAAGHPLEERTPAETPPAGSGARVRRLARLQFGGPNPALIDVHTSGELTCVVQTFATRGAFKAATMAAILDTFRFTRHPSESMTPLRDGVVTGHDAGYRYVAPSRFQLRDRDAFEITNSDVDQWAIDPILDQHIVTRCVRPEQDKVFDGPPFFNVLVDGLKGETTTLEVLTAFTDRHGRVKLSSASTLAVVDVIVHPHVACWAIARLAPEQAADFLPEVLATLDTFAVPADLWLRPRRGTRTR